MSKTIRGLLLATGAALSLGVIGTGVAMASPAPATSSTAVTAPAGAAQKVAPAEASTSETGSEPAGAAESGSPSDGPGGHADPAGNVDHQFDGTE